MRAAMLQSKLVNGGSRLPSDDIIVVIHNIQ